jgi:hypothetical protein
MCEFASSTSRVASLPPPVKALYTGFCALTAMPRSAGLQKTA